MELNPEAKSRLGRSNFWKYVTKTESNCLTWAGPIDKSGLPKFCFKHKEYGYKDYFKTGSFPLACAFILTGYRNRRKLTAKHLCTTPNCGNPDHIQWAIKELPISVQVSQMELRKSGKEKVIGKTHTKLTWDEVREIKKDTNSSILDLALRYRVTDRCIRDIKNKKTWRE